MIKDRIKLSIAASLMIATCSYAGTVTAPNSVDIELSGDVELKQVKEKSGSQTIDKRTADVNLAIAAKLKNGTKIITSFSAYDGDQGDAGATTELSIKEAYAVIPILGGKGKVIAGLAPNNQYGTEAFDMGGESWKIAVNMPVAKGVKVTVVSKVANEKGVNSNKGDSGAMAIRIDAKVGDFMIGAKTGSGYKNKGDGATGNPATTERKCTPITAYIKGKIAGANVGFEYVTKSIKLVGAPKNPDDPKGYFITAGKTFGNITAGIAYINLTKGMKGGDDFAPGMILDGNVNSSATKDTSAVVIPLSYTISDSITTNATLIKADIQGVDATELDLGLTYAMDDNIEIGAAFGKYSIDGGDDQTNVEVAIAITF